MGFSWQLCSEALSINRRRCTPTTHPLVTVVNQLFAGPVDTREGFAQKKKKGSKMWRFCCGINFFPPLHEKVCQLFFFFCFFLLGWLEFYKIIKCSIIYGARQQKRQKFFKRKKRLLFNAGLQSKKKIRGRVTLVLKELTNKQIFRQHTHTHMGVCVPVF